MTGDAIHIIAIHGAGFSGHAFDPLVPHLAGLGFGKQFHAPTLPAHGAGDTTAPLTSITDMVDWLNVHIDTIAAKKILLAGHSMGALVALAAADHPAVAGIALMAASLPMPVNDSLLQQAKDDPRAAASLIAKWGCDRDHPQAEAVRQTVLNQMVQTAPACLYADLAACNTFALADLPAKPALVITASRDKMTPPAAGMVLAEKLGAKSLQIEGGHMMMAEQAGAIAKALVEFAHHF